MTDKAANGVPEPPLEAGRVGIVRALLLLIGFRRATHHERQAERPMVGVDSPRVERVTQLARELASVGLDDLEAVKALRDAVGRRKSDLPAAAHMIRFEDNILESRLASRAHRLLVAAANGTAVEPVSPAEERWFEQIGSIADVPEVAGFGRLKAMQPGLAALEAEVQSRASEPRNADDDWWDSFCVRLQQQVGPEANEDDPLLRSETAYGVARVYLGRLAGVISDDW